MSSERVIELLVTWLPMVVVLALWLGAMKLGNRQYKSHVEQVNSINAEILASNREMLAELRQIKQALLDRKS